MYYSPFFNMIFGDYTVADMALPPMVPSPQLAGRYAYVTDRPGGAGYMMCTGAAWVTPLKRIETYNGTTDASGNYSVVYSPAFAATPHVNPVVYPAGDAITRVRVTAASATGFTVKTEKNNTLNVLGLDVLALGTVNVASVPVRIVVIES